MKLQRVDCERASTEELVSTVAFIDLVLAKGEQLGVKKPRWVEESRVSLMREIERRVEDEKRLRLKQVDARLEALQPTSEKRAALAAEKAALLKELGKAV